MKLLAILNLKTCLLDGPACQRGDGSKTWNRILPVWLMIWSLLLAGCETSSESVDATDGTKSIANQSPKKDTTMIKPVSINDVDKGVEHRLSGKPVTATLKLARGNAKAGETVDLSVILEVAALWEIRSMDAIPASVATHFKLKLPNGLQTVGEWQAPKPGRSMAPDGHSAYSGKNVFHHKIAVAKEATSGERQVVCIVRYQACDEHRCLKPTDVELKVPLQIE